MRSDRRSRLGRVLAAAAAALAVGLGATGLGGCTVVGGTASSPAASNARTRFVHDQQATLDLRTRPTRDSVGLLPGQDSTFFSPSHGSPGITTTVLLPTGDRLDLLAYLIASESFAIYDNSTEPGVRRQPNSTTVNIHFDSPAQARQTLQAQKQLLGLDQTDIDIALGDVPDATLAGLPASAGYVLRGMRRGFLSIEVELRSGTSGNLSGIYTFSYDLPDSILDLTVTDDPSVASPSPG